MTIGGRKFKSVGLRKKGYIGTAVSTRPSLKIKLDEYVKDQELGGLAMLTFNNNYQDESQARQWLAYSVMRKAGVPAPRCNLARVVVNGEDLGVYTHIESFRKALFERHFKNSNGDLYEGYGGDFTTNRFHRFVHKWGKDNNLSQLRKLLDLLQRSAPASPAEIGELLDLESFITFWAATVLVNHWDSFPGNHNNVYIYADPGSKKLHFMPWGADTSFGESWPPHSVKGAAQLCRRLWQMPEIQARYRKEMQRLLDSVWDEKTLLVELEKVSALCPDHLTLETGEVVASQAQIRTFIVNRRKEVQTELDAPPQPFREWLPPQGPATEPPKMMEIFGTFSAVMQGPTTNSLQATPFESGSASIEFTAAGQSHKPFTRYGAVAYQSQTVRKGCPSIRIVAVDDSPRLQWSLGFILDPHQARSGATNLTIDGFSVQSLLTQGLPGATNRQWRWGRNLSGTFSLEKFTRELGGEVSGTFRLKTEAFSD